MPKFIDTVNINAGWWIDQIKTKGNPVIGKSRGGSHNVLTCPTGIKQVNFIEGKRTGSIQFVCNDGTVTKTVGSATDLGSGSPNIFTCPVDNVLTKISADEYPDGIGNLKLECGPLKSNMYIFYWILGIIIILLLIIRKISR